MVTIFRRYLAAGVSLTRMEHSMSERLADLADRQEQALHAGVRASVERQHDKGKLTARERIDLLLDEGRSWSSTCWPGTAPTGWGSRTTGPSPTGW